MAENFAVQGSSDRFLRMVATMVCGRPADVILSERLKYPAALAAEDRKIFLDPCLCGMYDLFVLARLLSYRSEIKQENEYVPDGQVRQWIKAQRKLLRTRYPRLEAVLSGILHPAHGALRDSALPRLAWKQVEYNQLPDDAFVGSRVHEITGVDLQGIENDFLKLQSAIENGSYPIEQDPDLPEMPVARLSTKLTPSRGKSELLEAYDHKFGMKQFVSIYQNCYLARTQGAEDLSSAPRHRRYGLHLDANRLHDAVVAEKSGYQLPVFRTPRRERLANFRPEQHLSVLAVDINSLRRGSIDDPAVSVVFLLVMVKFFESMGVDFIVLSFKDRVLHLANGRDVYLHVPLVIKGVDEEMSEAWPRIDMAWQYHLTQGELSSFHPLQLKTIAEHIDHAAQNRRYKFYDLLYFNFHGLGGSYHTPATALRAAQAMSRICDELEERHLGHWYYFGVVERRVARHLKRQERFEGFESSGRAEEVQ